MLEKLKELNKKMLEMYKEDEVNLEKQKLIKEILEEDKFIFKIDMETAYAILRDLGVEENDLSKVYSELIDMSNYQSN